MSMYSKGLETYCDAPIVIPTCDDAENLADYVDSIRSMVVRNHRLIDDTASVIELINSEKRSWFNYWKSGC